MEKKIKIFIACQGTLAAIAIIISALLILFGMKDVLEWFFFVYFTVGVIVGLIFFWRFYSKRLE